MIRAQVRVNSQQKLIMSQDVLKDYVLSSLEKYISQEVAKHMKIDEQYDVMTDTTVYTGTYSTPHAPLTHTTANTITVSTTNGFNGTSVRSSVQEIFRVVEYTKDGKVTRVELQKYNEEDDSWSKVPRIQIEE